MNLHRVLLLSLVLLLCVSYAIKVTCEQYEEEEYENEEYEGGEIETFRHKKDGHEKEGHEKEGKKRGDDEKDGDEEGDNEKKGKKKGDDDEEGDNEKKGKKRGDDDKGDDDDEECDHEKEGKKKGDHKKSDHEKEGRKKGDHKKEGNKKGDDEDDDYEEGGKKKLGDHKKGENHKKGDHTKGGSSKRCHKKEGHDKEDHKKGGHDKGDHKKGGDDKGPIEAPVHEPIEGPPVEGPVEGPPVEGPIEGPIGTPVDEPIKGGTKGGGTIYDVTKFGAKGDGSSLNTQAFLKAWEQVCSSNAKFPVLVIPKGDYVLNPTEFLGPCNAPAVGVQLWGTIISSPKKSDWSKCEDFISFRHINNLELSGSGEIDGNGDKWWKNELSCGKRPTSLALNNCKGVRMSGIHSKNSARNHMSISGTTGATISGISLTAPDESPNTDGIDISSSSSITIENSFIGSGDDCIAINSHTKDVIVKNIKCGPGHGISIGSLGRGGEVGQVENVFVTNCIFNKTDNGARIKTWKGGRGYVRNIMYRDITLIDVRRPIIIDQNYVDKHHPLENEDSSLAISDVKFINFKGTTREADAITLKCSNSGAGCSGVELVNVHIQGASGVKPEATCENANVRIMQSEPQVSCNSKTSTLDYSEYSPLNETD